jgi:hypothetical protein
VTSIFAISKEAELGSPTKGSFFRDVIAGIYIIVLASMGFVHPAETG